jgi:site-specific DNA recombinase
VVVVYERVSTEKQDIARQAVQRDRARSDYSDAEIRVIQDDGLSAFKIPIFDRPGGAELCRLIESGSVAAIYTDAQDRLHRGEDDEWVVFRGLCDANDTWIVVDGQQITRDLGGKAISYLRALLARQESVEKSHRVQGGKRRAAERGRRNGGPRPFGYEHVPVVVEGRQTSRLERVPGEAKTVAGMFEGYASGKSQAEIARELNDAGITTSRGGLWSQSMVGQVLRNLLYRGKVTYRGEVFDGQHKPLVSDELWLAVEAVRLAATRRGGNGGGRPPKGRHLLTGGLLRCSCGATMRTRTQLKSYGTWEAYVCDGRHSGRTKCRAPAVQREEIDSAVWSYFETVGLDYEAMVRESDQRRAAEFAECASRLIEAEREHADTAARLARVRRAFQDGKLEPDDWREQRAELLAEQEAAAAAVDQLRRHHAELEETASLADAEEATREALRAIREALAGCVSGAADLAAARRVLRRLFDSFTLCRYDATPRVLDADLATGDWYLVPSLREDAILTPLVIGRDDANEPIVEQEQRLNRVPRQPSGSLR